MAQQARIDIEGYVAKNPETRQAGNHTVTTVTIPINHAKRNRQTGEWEPERDKDGNEIVSWYDCEFWNEYGVQIAQEIQKGYHVRVTGEPRARAYTKNDGSAGLSLTVVNPTISIIPRRPSRNAQGGSSAPGAASAGEWSSPAQNGAPNGAEGFGGGFDSSPF